MDEEIERIEIEFPKEGYDTFRTTRHFVDGTREQNDMMLGCTIDVVVHAIVDHPPHPRNE